MNIGGASIILLLVSIAMAIFAVLSGRASYHERKLAEKTVESVQNYYRADTKATEVFTLVNEVLKEFKQLSIVQCSKEEFEDAFIQTYEIYQSDLLLKKEEAERAIEEIAEQGETLTYIVPLDDTYDTIIRVELSLENGFHSSNSYQIVSYKMLRTENENYEEDEVQMWDGTFDEE